MRTAQDDFLIGVVDFCSFVMGVKNKPVIKYMMKTITAGSIGVIPSSFGSTIGFENTSGKEDKAAATIAAANPIVADVLILSLEKTELFFLNCIELDEFTISITGNSHSKI